MDIAKLAVLREILAILDKIYHTLIEQKPEQ